MISSPPFGLPPSLTISVGICSNQAIGPYGFANNPTGSSPYGGAHGLGISCYWTGKSWNGLAFLGKRKVTNPPSPLFPDVPSIQRLAVGANLWWSGTFFACGVNVAQFDYEALTAQSGVMYPNLDNWPGPNSGIIGFPPEYPDFGSPTPTPKPYIVSAGGPCPQNPPIRTFDWGSFTGPFGTWLTNDIGSFTHTGFYESRDLSGRIDAVAGLKLPLWLPLFFYYPSPFGPSVYWWSTFGQFAIGANQLNLFCLCVGNIF